MTEPASSKKMKTSNSILAGLLESGAYSDYVIECREDIYRVHRNVLSNFEFFAVACEQKFKEGIEQKLNLDDDDRDAMRALIQWMYSQDYNEEPRFKSKFDLHVDTYFIGKKYMEPQLQDLAKRKFAELVLSNTSWDNTLFMTAVHKLYKDGKVDEEFAYTIAETCVKNQAVLFEGVEEYKIANGDYLNDCHSLAMTLAKFAAETRMYIPVKCPSCPHQRLMKMHRNIPNKITCPDCPSNAVLAMWLPSP